MPASVAAVIARFDGAGDPLRPGEQAVVNDPYAGGTHLNDVTVVAPCHVDGRLVGWVANRAHHADLGGAAPGSLPADATDIAQEGLRIPPVRLTAEVRELIVASSRTPVERAGDLDAQIGANVVGVQRLAALAGQPFAEVLDYGERRCRAALAALGDGEWRAEDVLDSTGPRPDQQHPATIRCRIRAAAGALVVDFTGTDPQSSGNVNAVEAVTISCVAFALRSALDPTLPANAGAMRPVTVLAPEGSLVAARFPAAVGAGQRRGQPADRRRVPARAGAGGARSCRRGIAGDDEQRAGRRAHEPAGDDAPWVYYETIGGGQGGRPPEIAVARRARDERRAHGHDEHPQHAGGGARARLPDARAPPAPPAGERWRGRGARWRRHRT